MARALYHALKVHKGNTLPKPNNPAIELKEIPGKRFAVIRFSGTAGRRASSGIKKSWTIS